MFYMKMNLNVISRLIILNNLPEQGSFEKIANKRNVRNKISFSSDELDKMKLETHDDGIRWNPIDDVEVEFTDTEMKFLNDIVTDLDNKEMISESFFDTAMAIKDYFKEDA